MNQDLGPVLVEIYLERAHILGACREVHERRRLIDVLNHEDEVIEIEDARVSLGSGATKHYESIQVHKSAIVAAVPRETEEQNRRRTVLTSMIGKQETRQKALALIVPPLAIEGHAHVGGGAAGALSIKAFSKFFSLTGATLTMAGNPDRELGVVIVSRDRVVALCELHAAKLAQAI